jgi:hypothetical protein
MQFWLKSLSQRITSKRRALMTKANGAGQHIGGGPLTRRQHPRAMHIKDK